MTILFIFKIIIFVSGIVITFSVIPIYKSKIKMIEADHDYLFFPSLIFWFAGLEIFLLWLYGILISEIVHPHILIELLLQALIATGMLFNLIYILIIGIKYNLKYKGRE